MPTKKTYRKKTTVRRRRRAKVRRARRFTGVATSNRPFPLIRFAKLRYRASIAIDAGIGSPAYYTFVANGMYDPDSTGVGHQPMGFDELIALYNHYEVYGSRIKVTFFPAGSDCNVGVYLDDNASATADVNTLVEQRNSRSRVMTSANSRPVYVNHTYSQVKIYGKTSRGDDKQKGDVNANPSEKTYFMVFVGNVNANDPASMNVVIDIEYFAKFSELKTLVGS